MKTSYSALNTFETCALKYKYGEIEKRKRPKRVEQVFGTVVHNALRFGFERNPLYPTLDEILDFYTKKWNEAAEKIQWNNPERREQEEQAYFDEGKRLLTNFFKKNKPWQSNSVEQEEFFRVEIPDDEKNETHTLSGIIDRLDKDPQSEKYEIIDYKTGKKMPSQEMLEDDLQLGIYALAIHSRWPHVKPENITTSLYFLRHNDKVSAVHSQEKLERAKKRVLAIMNEIERRQAEDDFPPEPGPLCNWCEFRSICPMWAHEYKSEEEKKAPDEARAAEAIREFFEIKATEEQNKKRLAELRETITAYMDDKALERVFDSSRGYITRNVQERAEYDTESARPILEREGVWEKVLKPDTKEIENIKPTLSSEAQEELEKHKKIKKTTTLRQSKK